MTETDLLLLACRLNPAEDTPRLMLADELQAHRLDGAADYIRDDVGSCRGGGRRKSRGSAGLAYLEWLRGVLDGNLGRIQRVIYGASWSEFTFATGARRQCKMIVERGLPTCLKITAPMLLEEAPKLFQFPIAECLVTDRFPLRYYPSASVWMWEKAQWPQRHNTWEETASRLPPCLFDRLTHYAPRASSGAVRYYRLAGNAALALNRAALAFGRDSVPAGEPALTS